MNFLMKFRVVVVDIFHTNEGEIFVMSFFNTLINSSLICFANCKQGVGFYISTLRLTAKVPEKIANVDLFIMNYGHLAQEKLQQRVNFGEKYLSMLQLFLVLIFASDQTLSTRRSEAPLCR